MDERGMNVKEMSDGELMVKLAELRPEKYRDALIEILDLLINEQCA